MVVEAVASKGHKLSNKHMHLHMQAVRKCAPNDSVCERRFILWYMLFCAKSSQLLAYIHYHV